MAADAINSAITITAVFTHTDLIPDPISFTTREPTEIIYGTSTFTNAIASGYSGSGTIAYSSSDTSIVTVNSSSGQITIVKAGGPVTITAVKAADATYAGATAAYQLVVNKAPITVTPGTPSRSLIPFDSADNAYGTTTAIPITVSGLVGSDTIEVEHETAGGFISSPTVMTNGSNPSTNILTPTYLDIDVTANPQRNVPLLITEYDETNYTISGSPTVTVYRYDGRTAARAIPVTNDNLSAFNTYASSAGTARHYKLTHDITLTGSASTWTPIGGSGSNFYGSFDGNGKTINLGTDNVVTNNNTAGLFGIIGSGGVVKNLRLTGSFSVSIASPSYVGAVAGSNAGTVSNVSSSVSITAESTSTSATRQIFAGGIAGNNPGRIKNCYSTGAVTASGSEVRAGGIAGQSFSSGSIENSWASGNITGNGSTSNPYVGGIAGSIHQSATINNCVALNSTLTANSGTYTSRIAWSDAVSAFTNNYGNTIMTGGSWTNNKAANDGEDVTTTATEAGAGDWWKNTAGWSTVWGADEAHPWTWNTNRPKLWFE